MTTLLLALALLLQSGNASIGGFVQDPTQAYIPGVTITATNTQTGVASTTLTNESGTYTITGLLPGTYRVTAELPGFRTQIFNDVQLGQGVTARYNFTLQVGAVSDSVEVTAEATALIAESSPTIGQVLAEERVRDLPLVGNNVLSLMSTMAGVRGGTGSEQTTFAGISAGMVNTVRDGLSVQDGRYLNGVFGTTVINPELVGEMRVILAPVDAEMGRGNGQVQILTRSGTNQLRGAGVWTIRNSALDANTWGNNNDVVNGVWTPTKPDWFNRNEYTINVGGPIVKNKTFFFALWEQQFERRRTNVRPIILTDCARNGVFRYFDNWVNGNTNTVTNVAGTNSTRAVVDSFGNPVAPATNPDGSPYAGALRYFSVFGPLANTPTRPDCSDAVVQGNPWNSLRTGVDTTGVIRRYLDAMPRANRFDDGDGLNTAVHQWTRAARSSGSLAIGAGTETDTPRKQINLKIDHNFNTRHKIAANGSYEWTDADYLLTSWPAGYSSEQMRRPAVFTTNFTSTLGPALLNEARFGYRRNWLVIHTPWESTDQETREFAESMLLQGGQSYPIAFVPATVGGMTPNSFVCMTNCAQQGNNSPLFNIADTLSWTRGKHAFKGGVDIRSGRSNGYATPTAPIPKAVGGAGLNANLAFRSNAAMPNLVPNNETLANQLLYFLAGSVNDASQVYFLQNSQDLTKWENYFSGRKWIDTRQNEFAVFFKDDWKLHPSFTLNLGLRYEYYGVPYEGHGLTIVPEGGGLALLGVSGRSFDRWLRPDNGVDLSLLTKPELVGPNTPNPGKSIYKNDWNNLGPAIGFAWQLPWFGQGKTNVRGGYQITYSGGGRAQPIDNNVFNNPGFINTARTDGPADGSYFDLRNLPAAIPIPPSTLPLQPIPLQKQNQAGSAFDYNYATPNVQNFTLSVSRDVRRNLSVDVRYIGTRGLKLNGDFNLNIPNVFYNPQLFDALERTRLGEDVALFDQVFLGLNLNPNVRGCNPANPTALCGPVDAASQRGSSHLRLSSTFRTALANGNYNEVANLLNYFNGIGGGASGAVPGAAGERGNVLRRANRGFNVPGGTTVAGPAVPAGLFPENWITANPQFNAANYYTNSANSIYHSVQMQGTLRPTHGMSFQGTYIWSKTLGVPTNNYTNPAEREKDYSLLNSHRTHDFRGNGIFELPFGPNRPLFGTSPGWLGHIIGGWQTGIIVNLTTGAPTNIGATYVVGTTTYHTGLYNSAVADVVGPFELRKGNVRWGDQGGSGQLVGNFFESGAFTKVADPQCAALSADLRPYCTLLAVADAKTGQILLQNPRPGTRGTLGRQSMENPGSWDFDANLGKTFQISESKSLQVRIDATNILNHPNPSNPIFNLNSANPFGYIEDKTTARRQFQGMLRLSF
jgi:hypothetical protein